MRYLGFLNFANFYYQFIKSFNKITVSIISMLKITMLSQQLIVDKMLATNEVGSIKSGKLT